MGREREMGRRARGDVGGEGRALGAGAALLLAAVRGGGGRGWPSIAEVGDTGFLGGQRINKVKVCLAFLEENTQNCLKNVIPHRVGRVLDGVFLLRYLGGCGYALFGRTAGWEGLSRKT